MACHKHLKSARTDGWSVVLRWVNQSSRRPLFSLTDVLILDSAIVGASSIASSTLVALELTCPWFLARQLVSWPLLTWCAISTRPPADRHIRSFTSSLAQLSFIYTQSRGMFYDFHFRCSGRVQAIWDLGRQGTEKAWEQQPLVNEEGKAWPKGRADRRS